MQTTDETLYNPKDTGSVKIQGHIKIFDPVSNEVFVDKDFKRLDINSCSLEY